MKQKKQKLPVLWKETISLWAFGLARVPLIAWAAPRVIEFSETRCSILIPLRYRTKNHLGAMYFGALSVGADVAGGLLAMRLIQKSGSSISLVFKDFQAEFLKRAEGDVLFEFQDVPSVVRFVEQVRRSTERLNQAVQVIARVPSSDTPDEPVARFTLTLSLKSRSKTP